MSKAQSFKLRLTLSEVQALRYAVGRAIVEQDDFRPIGVWLELAGQLDFVEVILIGRGATDATAVTS
jgi:hypothetical protein